MSDVLLDAAKVALVAAMFWMPSALPGALLAVKIKIGGDRWYMARSYTFTTVVSIVASLLLWWLISNMGPGDYDEGRHEGPYEYYPVPHN